VKRIDRDWRVRRNLLFFPLFTIGRAELIVRERSPGPRFFSFFCERPPAKRPLALAKKRAFPIRLARFTACAPQVVPYSKVMDTRPALPLLPPAGYSWGLTGEVRRTTARRREAGT